MTSAKVDTSHYESTVNAATFSISVYKSTTDDVSTSSAAATFQATTTIERNILILKNCMKAQKFHFIAQHK